MRYTQEDRIKHLEFIQNIVNRMAANSFILKGWSVTIISGIMVLSLTNSMHSFIYLALIPAFIFWGLDAYYLRQERLFRALYDYVRKNNSKKLEPFSLDTNLIKEKVDSWFCTLFSKNPIALHLTITIIILIIIIGSWLL